MNNSIHPDSNHSLDGPNPTDELRDNNFEQRRNLKESIVAEN